MIPLKNVVISTKRPGIYTASTGTSAPGPYLSLVPAYAGPVPESDYRTGTAPILESDYLLKVDIGIDIRKGDIISEVCLNNSPVYSAWDELGINETLLVSFARNSSAGVLQHRRVYCKRITAGGPVV
jgi:hypothetical protein